MHQNLHRHLLKNLKRSNLSFFLDFTFGIFDFILFLEQTQLKLIFLYLPNDAKISFVFSSSITEYRRPFYFFE
jgi:hypothetical protein